MDDAMMINIPTEELNRSLAAQRVGELARSSDLFLSHFEQRAHLPIPESWMPDERPELCRAHTGRAARSPSISFGTSL